MKHGWSVLRNPYVWAVPGLVVLFYIVAEVARCKIPDAACVAPSVAEFLLGPGWAVYRETRSWAMAWTVHILYWFALSLTMVMSIYIGARLLKRRARDAEGAFPEGQRRDPEDSEDSPRDHRGTRGPP